MKENKTIRDGGGSRWRFFSWTMSSSR